MTAAGILGAEPIFTSKSTAAVYRNNVVVKDTTTPQTCRYTTLLNVWYLFDSVQSYFSSRLVVWPLVKQ